MALTFELRVCGRRHIRPNICSANQNKTEIFGFKFDALTLIFSGRLEMSFLCFKSSETSLHQATVRILDHVIFYQNVPLVRFIRKGIIL